MRLFFIIYFFVLLIAVSLLGFRGCKSKNPPLEVFPDMDRQSKLLEQAPAPFFDDNRADRPPVPGAVPHLVPMQQEYEHLKPFNHYREDDYIVTGRQGEGFGDGIPVEVSHATMQRGQEIYNINCAVCHGTTGNGKGVVADLRYNYGTIASLLQQRIMDQPDGEIFNTITHGKNTMMPYGYKIRPEDRWKVVLYVRALQRAATATAEDVPAEKRGELGL